MDNIDKSVALNAPGVIQIETSKLVPMMIVMAVLSGMAITFSFIGFIMMRDRVVDAETEARLLQYYVTGLDSSLIAQGIKQPGDDFEAYKKHHLSEQHR